MNQLQYIKNNNINIINNSVMKVPEKQGNNDIKGPINSGLQILPPQQETRGSNMTTSLKKKTKVDSELIIPQNKSKVVKPSVHNYTEMKNDELAQNAFMLAKDQGGCRFLQKKIEEEPDFANQFLFPRVFVI